MARPGFVGRLGAAMSGAITGAAAGAADGFSAAASGFGVPFNAASRGRRLRNWNPGRQGPNATVGLSAAELTARSRDAYRNDPTARRAVDLQVTHIVGTGIKSQSLCPDKATAAALMKLWADWVPFADADGQLDFYGLQSLAVREMILGGEAFCRLRTRRLSDGYPVPLQVQVLPTEMLPLAWNVPMDATGAGTTMLQGIERNGIGQRLAYWFYPVHPTDVRPMGDATLYEPSRVPAAQVAHLFNVVEAGQLRGLPHLAAALTTLHHVDGYLDAELERKKAAALITAFVEQAAGDAGLTPEQLAAQGPVEQGPDGAFDLTYEPGTISYLRQGEKMTFNTPADVGPNFDVFLTTNYRRAAQAAGAIYEELSGDWRAMNDRTYRASFNTLKRSIMAIQYGLVAQQMILPVWSAFCSYAEATGAVLRPAGMTDADFARVAFVPQRWDYINPAQDIAAIGDEIALGLQSRSGAILARGDDPAEINAQIVADKLEEKKNGLSFGLVSMKPEPQHAEENAVGPGDPASTAAAPPSGANQEPAP